jgi:hypothetical protein
MSDSPGQIVCTIANDSRLIAAGAAAVSQQAARRAGLSWEAQEEIAVAAIEVSCKAFPPGVSSQNSHSSIRLGLSDLPDRIELTLEVAESHERVVSAPVATSLHQTLAEQVHYEAGKDYFRMTISKLCRTQSVKPSVGESPAR